MRPTKYDYDRYLKLVQLGVSVNWEQDALKKINPFRVADPTMTFTLLRANRDLRDMGEMFGEDTSQIETWITILEEGAATLWNDDIKGYDSRDAHTCSFNGILSNASALCWYAGLDNPKARPSVERMLAAAKYGLASFDPEAKGFEPLRYWRGPTWPIMNYLVGSGLEEMGVDDLAGRIRNDTTRLMRMNGFAEYYDPLSGQPAGGDSFTWTAAVWLGWAGQSAAKEQGVA